ncbi:hypothetical protein LINGRAHAP2_LOCUS36326 [Linum grandiflorum]
MAACRYDDYEYDSAFASVFDCGDETDNDQPDFGDWNAGLVYARARGVTLCLINSVGSEGKIKSRALHIKFQHQAGMGITLVDSNLYAFGYGYIINSVTSAFRAFQKAHVSRGSAAWADELKNLNELIKDLIDRYEDVRRNDYLNHMKILTNDEEVEAELLGDWRSIGNELVSE